jgi:hypothetical protein
MTRRVRLTEDERTALLDQQRNMTLEEQLLEEANALHWAICAQEGANPGAGRPFKINTARGLALARARTRTMGAIESLQDEIVEADVAPSPDAGSDLAPSVSRMH